MWAHRDLSLFGRIFLTKMESISRFIYPAYSMAIPKSALKAMNQANLDLISYESSLLF